MGAFWRCLRGNKLLELIWTQTSLWTPLIRSRLCARVYKTNEEARQNLKSFICFTVVLRFTFFWMADHVLRVCRPLKKAPPLVLLAVFLQPAQSQSMKRASFSRVEAPDAFGCAQASAVDGGVAYPPAHRRLGQQLKQCSLQFPGINWTRIDCCLRLPFLPPLLVLPFFCLPLSPQTGRDLWP